VCIAGATASFAQQAVAEIWPVAWTPAFEEISPSTLVLTNRPSETGIILPIDRVDFAKHAGDRGNAQYTTYLVGSPRTQLSRGAYSVPNPSLNDMFYLQWRIWPPNNTTMTAAHWHRELRTEAFVFGSAYWHGSGRVVEQSHRTHQMQGDFLVEEAGGHHFGWTDPDTHENTVFFIFGSEPMVDAPLGPEVPAEKHNTFYSQGKIPWGPGQGTGPMTFNMVGDETKAGYFNELNKWSPGNAIKASKYSADRYGMVVSGRVYIGWGNKMDPKNGHLMTQGTFFSQPAGMNVFMYVPAGEQEDAVVIMYGKGPVTITPVE
jgi:hypothetical protein